MTIDGFVFAVRRGCGAPVFVEIRAECQRATSGFSRPLFRKIPRANAARHLQFELDEAATNFKSSVHLPAQSRLQRKGPKGKGKGKDRGGGMAH
jgi:hypothetical protein